MKIDDRIEPFNLGVTVSARQRHQIRRWRVVGIRATGGRAIEYAARWMSFANEHRATEEIERALFRKRRPTGARHFGQIDLGDESERDRL